MELLATLVILLLIVAAYWSLVVLPKQQEFKKHQKFVRTLNVGEVVVTYGGIIGTITALDPEAGVATVQVADGIELRLITAAITQYHDPVELTRNIQMGTVEDRA